MILFILRKIYEHFPPSSTHFKKLLFCVWFRQNIINCGPFRMRLCASSVRKIYLPACADIFFILERVIVSRRRRAFPFIRPIFHRAAFSRQLVSRSVRADPDTPAKRSNRDAIPTPRRGQEPNRQTLVEEIKLEASCQQGHRC